MRPPQTWKEAERRIARMLGLVRVGNRGSSTPDAEGPALCAEVKHRRARGLPAWALQALERVRAQAGPRRLGVLVVHLEGQPYGESLVVMTLRDYADWYVSPLAGADDAALRVLAPDLLAEESAVTA